MRSVFIAGFMVALALALLSCKSERAVEEGGAAMEYRSISFHMEPDSNLIIRASEIGFNNINFETEGSTRQKLEEIRKMEDEKGYMKLAKEHGMSVSVWMREISDYEKDWGPVSMDNELFWERTGEKYDRYFTALVPEADYIIFTVVESQINIADNEEVLNRMVRLVNDKCREYGKKLILRTFVHYPHELDTLERQIAGFPDDIMIMSKFVESDWHLRGPDHRMIGRTGEKKQVVEIDVTGEYYRVTYLPNCFTENLEQRFNYWKEQGIDGITVRVSRAKRPGAWWEPLRFDHNIYAEPNEVNLWALGYLSLGKADAVDRAWKDFAVLYFGEELGAEMRRILEPQGEIVAEALNVEMQPFGCTRLMIPGEWTMNGKHCECGETMAVAYPDEEDMLYRNPFYHKMSPHIWHNELAPRYHLIRKGDPDVILAREESTGRVIALSDSLLVEYRKLQERMAVETYAYYLFKLEENNWHLRVMREWHLAWMKASNMLYYGDDKGRMGEEVAAHLDNLLILAQEQDKTLRTTWYGKQVDIHRGEYLDIPGYIGMFRQYWREVL